MFRLIKNAYKYNSIVYISVILRVPIGLNCIEIVLHLHT